MSDFLTRLIERTQGVVPVAQPLIPPMFAMAPTTLYDNQQSPSQGNELLKVPNNILVHSPKTLPESFVSPQKNSTLEMPRQPSHKIDNIRFAQLEDIESDDSERIETESQPVISGQIDSGDFELASSLVNHRIQINNKLPKKNFSDDHEFSTTMIVSEHDQSTIQQPEHSHDFKRTVNVVPNMHEAELDQNNTQEPKHLPDEKQNASSGSIDSLQTSAFRETSEIKRNQNINQQPELLFDEKKEFVLRGITEKERHHNIRQKPEHSFYEESNASGKSIDSEKESVLQGIKKTKNHQYTSQKPELLFNKEKDAPGRSIDSGKASSLQGKTESYLNPYSPGKIGLQQAVGKESSAEESIIKVTIGRVEVRAIMPPAAAGATPRSRSQSQILSLNDYLKQRNEGKR
jgi:hypothetical protein